MEKSKLDIFLKIFLFIIIISLITFLGIAAFLLIRSKVIDLNNNDPNSISGFGIVFVIVLATSAIVNGILLLLSFILCIISVVKKNRYKKYYILTTFLPMISELLIIALGIIINMF